MSRTYVHYIQSIRIIYCKGKTPEHEYTRGVALIGVSGWIRNSVSLISVKECPALVIKKSCWAPEPVWLWWGRTILFSLPANRSSDFQPLAIHSSNECHNRVQNYANTIKTTETKSHNLFSFFFFFLLALLPQFGPWPTFSKLSVSLRFTRS
jgi:hypothetical protein